MGLSSPQRGLPRVRSDQIESVCRPGACPERQVEQWHDSAVDRSGVLDLERGTHLVAGGGRGTTFARRSAIQHRRSIACTHTRRTEASGGPRSA